MPEKKGPACCKVSTRSGIIHQRFCNSGNPQQSAVTEPEQQICISRMIFVTHSSGDEIFWVHLAFGHVHTAVTDMERPVSVLNLLKFRLAGRRDHQHRFIIWTINLALLTTPQGRRCFLEALKTSISGHIHFGLKMSDCDRTSYSYFLHHREMDIFEHSFHRI
jgi:hypothetical protein